MPHCTKCGTAVADNAESCPSCGAPQAAGAPVGSAAPAAGAVPQTGLEENVAGLLCYLLGWVTGLAFFLIDKRASVQFHARQSIVIFGGLSLVWLFVMPVWGLTLFVGGWGLVALLSWLLRLVGLVLWIVCMIKAYQGGRFRVPVAAGLSEKIFGKV